MKLFKSVLSRGGLIGLLLMCCATLASAGASRPFKGTVELTATGMGRLEKCPGSPGLPGGGETVQGTGHATHLGAIQLTASHCVNLVQEVNFYLFNGEMAVIASNGDVVHADYSGFLTLVSPGVYSFEGNYFIKDGTGRFDGAIGTGALVGTGSLSSLTLTADGSISY